MEKQRQIKILSIVALVLAISAMTLGFAAFSTTLNISSSASVTPNSTNFSVVFSANPSSSVNTVEPSYTTEGATATPGKIVNSTSPTLTNLSANFTAPGQYVEYTLYIRNVGQYTAYLNNINYLGEKTCIAESHATESLVQSACENINVNVEIEHQSFTETSPITNKSIDTNSMTPMTVIISYAFGAPPVDGPFNITFPSIALVYSTVDDSSIDGKVVRLVSGNINTPSSIVAIGNEQFYVFGKENGNVKLLSMYNLRVGRGVVWDSLEFNDYDKKILTNTGIQGSDAKGAMLESTIWLGITAFSDTSSTYSGSIVEGYVNNYKTYLTNMGVDISSARLITKSELETLGCSSSSNSCSSAPSWVYSTSYWSGTAYDTDYVWRVSTSKRFNYEPFNRSDAFGVRPVIEIPISEFE